MDSKYVIDIGLAEGERLWRELEKSTPIKCAFWLLPDRDCARWTLNIASDHFINGTLNQAYGEVARILHDVPLQHLSMAGIKLVRGDEPIVRDVINVRLSYPGPLPIPSPISRLGGQDIAGAYLYALPDAVARMVGEVSLFSPDEQQLIDRLTSHNIRVSVQVLGEQYYACYARNDADHQNPQVTYGHSKIDVLQKITGLVEKVWPDLMASAATP